MSRPAQRSGAAAAAARSNISSSDNGGELHEHFNSLRLKNPPATDASSSSDICPVCKSMRYLNQGMTYMVNPECYHKMCESCVDRIFSSGPAPCPIAGCKRTLRKNKFRKQTFEDVSIEREVDIRRRVGNMYVPLCVYIAARTDRPSFNRREDDFDTLLDFNNYLNEVEDVTYDLIHGTIPEIEAAEKKLQAHAAANRAEIQRNALLAKEESASLKSREAAAKEQARSRYEAELREEELERQARLQERQEVLNQLASGGDATVILKKAQARRTVPINKGAIDGAASDDAFVIKGLKKRTAAEPEKTYDPFHDLELGSSYFVVQDRYPASWLEGLINDKKHIGGGYEMREYYTKTLFEAFSGFGVFVQEEVADRTLATGAFDGTITNTHSPAARKQVQDVSMDDVF